MPSTLPDYFDLPLKRFLDDAAGAQPTPGGGSVTALSAVLGCTLARMTAAYTLSNPKRASDHPVVSRLRDRIAQAESLFRSLAFEDMQAYQDYDDARKNPDDSPEGKEQLRRATLTALAVPLEIAAVASTALTTCDELKDHGGRFLLSDLLAGAHLLHGAAHAAAANARVNLKSVDDAELAAAYRSQITGALSHADLHLASIHSTITKVLALPA